MLRRTAEDKSDWKPFIVVKPRDGKKAPPAETDTAHCSLWKRIQNGLVQDNVWLREKDKSHGIWI